MELTPTDRSPTIRLTVLDAENGQRLIGTPVYISSTTIGALTDMNGYAEIVGPLLGVHDLVISMVGCYSVVLKHVAVIEGYITNLGEIRINPVETRTEQVIVR